MRENTATGHDGLPACFLKKTANTIAPHIAKILNSSISSGKFPDWWKKANISAVYKGKGSKKEATNYRPISVLPCLSRIFEKEIAKQLLSYCISKEIIPKEQFGFRPKSSCETALLTALNCWIGEIDKLGMMVGVLLVDLSKAFDNVNHSILIKDLEEIGCDTSALTLFISYLSDRKQRVTSGLQVTDWQYITKGVPQGSCISPLLFNIYVRKLPNEVRDPIFQFADDITNSTTADRVDEIEHKLTANFQQIKDFCLTRDLKINTDKTQCILLKLPSKKIEKELELCLDDHIIKSSSTVDLLGVTIDQHLSFRQHIEKTARKCHGIIGVIKKARAVLPPQLLKLSYTALVRPHLEYCNLIFASSAKSNLTKLETVQKIASRIICGERRDAHAEPLLNKLGLQTLRERRELKIVRTVKNIVGNNCHPYLSDMFRIESDGLIQNNFANRTTFGKKRFSIYAKEAYNNILLDISE